MSVRTYPDGTTENFKYVYGNGLISQEWRAEVSDKTGIRTLEGSYSAYITYHFNHLGSTVMLTDKKGSIAETYKYGTESCLTEMPALRCSCITDSTA